jgi:Ca2+-binding RTX toxin-like protein
MAGNDRLINRTTASVIFQGGAGNDILISGLRDGLYGGEGNDYLLGGPGESYLDGGAGNDRLIGGGGNDTYLFASGVGFERDELLENRRTDAGNTDTLDFSASGLPLVLEFTGNRGRATDPGRVINIRGAAAERIIGSTASDIIHSHPATTYIDGREGDDQIFGNPLSQTLIAGNGNNTVYGLGGNDTINGGAGNDRLIAFGSGNNFISGGLGADWLQGGAGNDHLEGGSGDDVIFGLAGDDFLYGDEGSDHIAGGAGNDSLWNADPDQPVYSNGVLIYTPPHYSNILLGGPGDDIINGQPTNDDEEEDFGLFPLPGEPS